MAVKSDSHSQNSSPQAQINEIGQSQVLEVCVHPYTELSLLPCYNIGLSLSQTHTLTHNITDNKPTIAKLKVLESATGGTTINVIECLAPKWTDLGDLLEFDSSSSKLDEIEDKYPNNPEACCRAMFIHWLKGNGVQPCTWSKLIKLLKCCKQEKLARAIEAAISVTV